MRRPLVSLLVLGSFVALGSCDDPTAPGSASLAKGNASDAPSGLYGTAVSETQIDLTWEDNSRNETGFEIHRSTTGPDGTYTLRTRTAGNAVGFSDAGLTRTTQYCYKARWFRTTGKNTTTSVFSETACTYTLGPPLAPSASVAPDATRWEGAWIDVRWTDPLNTAQTFSVARADDPSGTWTALVADLPSWTRSYRDPNRPVEVRACYRVTGTNTWGSSPPSAVKCTIPPQSPTGLTAGAVSATAIRLAWTNNSTVNDGFEIQRSLEGSYWNTVAVVPAVPTSYQDEGLVTDRRYYYRVRATKDGGYSAFSDVANALASGSAPASSPTIDAVANGSYATWISWYNHLTPNTDGYRIERSLDNGGSWETAGTVGAFEWYFADAERTPEQRLCYKVTAYNGVGSGPPSNTDCVTPLATPNDFSASPGGEGAINLTWTDGSTANTGYVIEYLAWYYDPYYGYSYPYWTPIAEVGANATSYRATGFWSGELHLFRVYPTGPDGNGNASNEAGSYTEPPPPASD